MRALPTLCNKRTRLKRGRVSHKRVQCNDLRRGSAVRQHASHELDVAARTSTKHATECQTTTATKFQARSSLSCSPTVLADAMGSERQLVGRRLE